MRNIYRITYTVICIQATTDRKELTSELAKILGVLEVTLKQKKAAAAEGRKNYVSSSDSGEEKREVALEETEADANKEITMSEEVPRKDQVALPEKKVAEGKPPKHPKVPIKKQQDSAKLATAVTAASGAGGGNEMHILSKILVTLLCSCKSAEAAR